MSRTFSLGALKGIALGFVIIILSGSLLLMLPFSHRGELSYIDALFTATSATCVTGLTVVDTYQSFTVFGQFLLMIMIQLGGLGFLSFATLIPLLLGRRIGLRTRAYLVEAVGSPQLGGIVRVVKRLLLGTFLIQLLGASLLAIRLIPRFGVLRGSWMSLFTSVSAFCNAGFDVFGIIEPGTSLVPFRSDPLVIGVISFLLIIGGLGFILWDDLMQKKLDWRHYRVHTKIVLIMTGLLLVFGTLFFLYSEKNGVLQGTSGFEAFLIAFFQSTTTRTAGFFSVGQDQLSSAGTLLTMLLMIIGASPSSTGGGIKTTTFFALLYSGMGYARGKNDLTVFGRRLGASSIEKAHRTTTMYLFWIILGGIGFSLFTTFALEQSFFEIVSAIGTVGLSKGITSLLNIPAKLTIIMLMYIGRVGSVTLATALMEKAVVPHTKAPSENIPIG